jgi:hypothetical protein
MRENRTSGSMRGCRKRATSRRACALLYAKRAFAPNFAMRRRFASKARGSACFFGRGGAVLGCFPPSYSIGEAPIIVSRFNNLQGTSRRKRGTIGGT